MPATRMHPEVVSRFLDQELRASAEIQAVFTHAGKLEIYEVERQPSKFRTPTLVFWVPNTSRESAPILYAGIGLNYVAAAETEVEVWSHRDYPKGGADRMHFVPDLQAIEAAIGARKNVNVFYPPGSETKIGIVWECIRMSDRYEVTNDGDVQAARRIMRLRIRHR